MYAQSPLRHAMLLLLVVVCSLYFQSMTDLSSDRYVTQSSEFDGNNFDVLMRDVTNEQKHLYPYLAAFISVTCLVGTIMIIICMSP